MTPTPAHDPAKPPAPDAADTAEFVRRTVYRHLSVTGRAPERTRLAAETGLSPKTVDEAYDELAAAHHLVLGQDGRIVLAHPFATRNFGFSVMGARTLWWGGCAWDSFAIPHLVPDEPAVLIATTCPACATPLAWTVGRDTPPAGAGVAHFLVPVDRIWDDVVHTCAHQRIFCDEECVEAWLARTGSTRGSVFGLDTLWRLAAHWYEGRLDSPYRRREPRQALDYFRGVGLTGAFWGTPEA